MEHLLCTRRRLGPPSRLCSLSRAPRGEYFPAFQHPQGCPRADWHGWSPRGEAEAPGGRQRSPGGKMKTESWADMGRPSTSHVNSLKPLHNLMSHAVIIPTLQRRKLRFHNCYRMALTLHGTRLWVKPYYEFLFHLDNGFLKKFLITCQC